MSDTRWRVGDGVGVGGRFAVVQNDDAPSSIDSSRCSARRGHLGIVDRDTCASRAALADEPCIGTVSSMGGMEGFIRSRGRRESPHLGACEGEAAGAQGNLHKAR